MHLGRDFQAQAVQADETGGVVLVVGLGRVGFHRGLALRDAVVEAHVFEIEDGLSVVARCLLHRRITAFLNS